MSFTDGADQADTPPIGVASPSPRAPMPSPLGAFARQIFSGRPAPQPAGPGRSPFEFPGQSQIPQQGPAGAQPGGPRWSGTTASLALPRGTPQPRDNFTPFQRSLPTRDPSEWGQPENYPRLPASFEVPSIFQGASQFFGQNGSGLSIPLALALGKNANAFMEGLMKGQKFKADQARQQMLDNALALQVQEEEQHRRYGDTIARYVARNETDDYSKLTKGINGVSVRDALWADANQMQDRQMINMIEDGASISELVRYQQLRDANLSDLRKANTKAAEQQEDDSAYTGGRQVEGPSGGRAPLGGTITAGVGPLELPQPAPQTGKPAPTETGGPLQGRPGEAGEDAKVDEYVSNDALPASWIKDYPKLAREVMGRGDIIRGRLEGLGGAGKSVPPTEVATKDATGRWRVSDKVRDLNRMSASDLEQMLNYETPAGGGQGGSGASPGTRSGRYGDMLRSLARKATENDPIPWNQNFYQEQRNFAEKTQWAQALSRIGTISTTGAQLVAGVDRLPDSSIGTMHRMFDAFVQGKLEAGDPYVAVFNAWKNYNIEKNVLLSATGGSVTQQLSGEHVVPPWADAAAYRVAVVQDAQNALQRYDQFRQQWRKMGGRDDNMPDDNPEAVKGLRVLSQMNPADGTITQPSGKRWKYTGANPLDVNAPENWEEQK